MQAERVFESLPWLNNLRSAIKKAEENPKIRRIVKYASWLLPIIAFTTLCIVVDKRTDMWIDSDMSSELILSKLLAEDFGILSKEWYYSTELRVLNTQLIYTPLFWIFDDWHTVRLVANIIMYIILAASYIFFCRCSRLGKYTPYLLTILLLPVSMLYYLIVLFGAYYIPHISISFVILGLMIKCMTASGRKKRLIYGACGALSLVAGMGGFRQPFVLFIPLFVSALIIFIGNRNEKNKNGLICAVIGLFGSFVGLLINTQYLSAIYHFEEHNDMSYTLPVFDNFWTALIDMLSTLGYSTGGLFSAATLINVMCLVVLVCVIVSVYLCIKDRLPEEHRQLVLFVFCAVIVFSLFYTVTDMQYVSRYNIPIVVFFPAVLVIACENIRFKKGVNAAILGIVLIGVVASSAQVYNSILVIDRTAEHRAIVSYLQESDSEEITGYASFWNANVLTELSDGEIEVRHWSGVGDDNIENPQLVFPWLQEIDNSEPISGSFFLLLDRTEYEAVKDNRLLKEADIAFQTENYVVFAYDDLTDYYALDTKLSIMPEENTFLINGYDADGVRNIQKDGISYGPYLTLPAGKYEVTFKGNNLDLARYDCVGGVGETNIKTEAAKQNDNELTYAFELAELTEGIEFRLFNTSDEEPVSISEMYIEAEAEIGQ